MGKLPSGGYKTRSKVYSRELSEHTNAALEFQRWCPAKPRQHDAMPVITAHSLTVCVDHLYRPPLVFCYLLTACDCSAISPCTTTVRPRQPSSWNFATTYLTSGLLIFQPTTSSATLRSNETRTACVFSWRWDNATDGHISYRPIQPSRLTRRVLLTLCVIRHASVTIFVFGTFYYKCVIRLSACDEFLNIDVCVTVLKGNSLNGDR